MKTMLWYFNYYLIIYQKIVFVLFASIVVFDETDIDSPREHIVGIIVFWTELYDGIM